MTSDTVNVGSVVIYSCKVGFTKTQGEQLVCQLVGDEAEWVGEVAVCTAADKPSNKTGACYSYNNTLLVQIVSICFSLFLFYFCKGANILKSPLFCFD